MKRIFLLLVAGYVLMAAGNRVAEHFGMMRCGCAKGCWCHRPGLSLFRWVFPWGHRSAHSAEEKADLDLA
ncbi:hypothetical protein [Nocardioides caldifontis]|uniref:hypothetical protein n=1 Tax=Nocardioides caldifontis TaxID=2588938 RepID=UPI001396BE01|nr:hypothetical protein [Nocardioides caldifontis]